MILGEARTLLDAEVIWGTEYLEREIISACGADLMSDVLAFTKEKTVLLTGLTNLQVIRTAEISDLAGIVFVRGKRPGQDVVDLASLKEIPLMVTSLPMFEACGRLYIHGVQGCSQVVMTREA